MTPKDYFTGLVQAIEFAFNKTVIQREVSDTAAIYHARRNVMAEIYKYSQSSHPLPVKCTKCGFERTVWSVCPSGCDTSNL